MNTPSLPLPPSNPTSQHRHRYQHQHQHQHLTPLPTISNSPFYTIIFLSPMCLIFCLSAPLLPCLPSSSSPPFSILLPFQFLFPPKSTNIHTHILTPNATLKTTHDHSRIHITYSPLVLSHPTQSHKPHDTPTDHHTPPSPSPSPSPPSPSPPSPWGQAPKPPLARYARLSNIPFLFPNPTPNPNSPFSTLHNPNIDLDPS